MDDGGVAHASGGLGLAGWQAGWRGWMGPRALFLGKRPEVSQETKAKIWTRPE